MKAGLYSIFSVGLWFLSFTMAPASPSTELTDPSPEKFQALEVQLENTLLTTEQNNQERKANLEKIKYYKNKITQTND